VDPSAPADPARARAQARVGLALFRGLLLDLVGTEDRAGVDAAFDEFRALVERDVARAMADQAVDRA
jgi:hypothetical protein